MMPDSNLRDALLGVVKSLDSRSGGGLRGLAIVCRVSRNSCPEALLTPLKSSPLIDDAMLKDMALHLRTLKRLTLWGCTRITKAGVFNILREAEYLEELSLDALPHSVSSTFNFRPV